MDPKIYPKLNEAIYGVYCQNKKLWIQIKIWILLRLQNESSGSQHSQTSSEIFDF
jgi:hypothetical protein